MSNRDDELPSLPGVGIQIGSRIVVEIFKAPYGRSVANFARLVCVCGAESVGRLRMSLWQTRSCRSCWQKTHSMSHTPEHDAWINMRRRCENPEHSRYADWGGRGIKVCERWQHFENFLVDMGKRPSPKHSLGRKKNDEDYGPDNCEWQTPTQQSRNRRYNRPITWQGETLLLTDWAARLGITPASLRERLDREWPIEEALTFPKSWPAKRKRGNHST